MGISAGDGIGIIPGIGGSGLSGEIEFTPASLFANGEQGWFWSGIDITKVYQDELGTVPVTADADPVRFITDLSGNGNNFSTTTFVPEWDASSPFSGIGTVRSEGTSDRITFPNIGSATGQFYLVWDGGKSIVCNAQFNVINAYHKYPHNLVAAIFIDRAFTAGEVAALDELYQDTIVTTDNFVYRGMFEQMPITDVVTDLSGFGINGSTDMFMAANKLTEAPSFPLKGNISGMFNGCSSLTTMPNVDASEVIRTNGTWQSCSSLTSFPPLDLSGSDDYANCWRSCGLTSFSGVDFSNSTGDFDNAWLGCTSLTDFGANMFDTCVSINFSRAFELCALTQASVDNILVSVDSAGTSNGVLDIDGGTNSAPGAAGTTAISNLAGRGWTVTTN